MSKPKQPPQVCISMPTYDLMQVSTCLSLIKLMDRFTMAKIKSTVQTFKSPYVGYGRNVLTAMFLETGMDYQLFVDSDMEFEPDIIGRMIIAEKDAICVPYRKKTQDNAVRFSVAFEDFNNIDIDNTSIFLTFFNLSELSILSVITKFLIFEFLIFFTASPLNTP